MFKDSAYSVALKHIKINGHHMKQASETRNLKETLRYSREMLSQLSVEGIDIKDYYSLFMIAFQEMQWLQGDLSQMDLRERKYDLYEVV